MLRLTYLHLVGIGRILIGHFHRYHKLLLLLFGYLPGIVTTVGLI